MPAGCEERTIQDERLRQEASDLGIRGAGEMSRAELTTAIAERRRGADPKQAEAVARGQSHT